MKTCLIIIQLFLVQSIICQHIIYLEWDYFGDKIKKINGLKNDISRVKSIDQKKYYIRYGDSTFLYDESIGLSYHSDGSISLLKIYSNTEQDFDLVFYRDNKIDSVLYLNDNEIDGFYKYKYDSIGRVIKEIGYNEDNVQRNDIVYKYDSTRIIDLFDSIQKYGISYDYRSDDSLIVTSYDFYHSEEKRINQFKYVINISDTFQIKEWYHYINDSIVLVRNENIYFYGNGNKRNKTINYRNLETFEIDNVESKSFDTQGRVVKFISERYKQPKIINQIRYVYEGDKLKRKIVSNPFRLAEVQYDDKKILDPDLYILKNIELSYNKFGDLEMEYDIFNKVMIREYKYEYDNFNNWTIRYHIENGSKRFIDIRKIDYY